MLGCNLGRQHDPVLGHVESKGSQEGCDPNSLCQMRCCMVCFHRTHPNRFELQVHQGTNRVFSIRLHLGHGHELRIRQVLLAFSDETLEPNLGQQDIIIAVAVATMFLHLDCICQCLGDRVVRGFVLQKVEQESLVMRRGNEPNQAKLVNIPQRSCQDYPAKTAFVSVRYRYC